MAVAFDAVGPGATGTSSTTSPLTWSHTCTGSNGALVVGVSFGQSGGGSGADTNAVTYNGVSMTRLGAVASNNGTDGYVELYGLIGPSTGSNTVSVSHTTAGSLHHIVGGSVSFTGAASFGTAVTNFGSTTTPTVNVTGTTAGNMVVDACTDAQGITSSNQTQRWKSSGSDANTAACNAAQSTAAAGGTITMSYSAPNDWWGIVAVEVVASAATASSPVLLAIPPVPFVSPWGEPVATPFQLLGDQTPVTPVTLTETAAVDDQLSIVAVDGIQRPFLPFPPFTAPFVEPSAIPLQMQGDRPTDQAITLADTASGSDSLTVAAAIPLAETATGNDSLTVAAAIPLAETAAGADAATITAAVPLAETAAGDDSLSLNVGTDPNQFIPGRAPMFYNIQLATQFLGSDDANTGSASISLADTANAADSLTVAAAIPLAETATGDDSLVATSGSDTNQFVPGRAPMFYNIQLATQFLGTSEVVTTAVSLADTASAADSLSVQSSGADDPNQAGPQIAWMFEMPSAASFQLRGDAAAAANQSPSLPDTATGDDALTATAAVPLAETATAADSLSIQITAGETVQAAQPFPPFAAPFIEPNAVPLQMQGNRDVIPNIALSENPSAVDQLAVAVDAAFAEVGLASDSLSVVVSVPLAETVSAADLVTVGATLSVSETASATDAMSVVNVLLFEGTITGGTYTGSGGTGGSSGELGGYITGGRQ